MTTYTFRFFPNEHPFANWYNDVRETKWLGVSNGGVAWTAGCDDVNINMNGILAKAKDNNISFDEMLSHGISHELIHNILNNMFDTEVSTQFDNICYVRNKKFKT